jgi:pectate lyase
MQLTNSAVLSIAVGAVVVSAAATTTFPSAAGSTSLSAPITVSGTYDGKMYRYDRGSMPSHLIFLNNFTK